MALVVTCPGISCGMPLFQVSWVAMKTLSAFQCKPPTCPQLQPLEAPQSSSTRKTRRISILALACLAQPDTNPCVQEIYNMASALCRPPYQNGVTRHMTVCRSKQRVVSHQVRRPTILHGNFPTPLKTLIPPRLSPAPPNTLPDAIPPSLSQTRQTRRLQP